MSYNQQGYPGQYSQPPPDLNKSSAPGPGNYPGAQYPPQQQQQQQQQGYGSYPPPQQQGYGAYPPPQQQQGYGAYPPPPQQQGYNAYPPQSTPSYPGMGSGAYGQYQTSSYGYNAYGATAGYTAPGYSAYAPPTYPSTYGYASTTTTMTPTVITPVTTAVVTPVVADIPYIIHFKGSRLDRKDVFSKSDPFFTISVPKNPLYISRESKSHGGSTANWAVVYRSETIRNDQNPVWQSFSVGLHTLCGGNLERPIKIEVFDYDHNGAHDKIGSGITTVRELQVMKELRLINKKRLGIGSVAGTLEVLKIGPQ